MNEKIFDQDEQDFIIHLNSNPSGTSIQNYLDPILSRISVLVSRGKNMVSFKFEIQSISPTPQELQWITKTSDELQLKLVKLTRLLEFLEHNGLAYAFVPAYSQTSLISFGQCPINAPSVTYQIYDPETISGVLELSDKTILPTPSLSKLQKCNFLFPEEVRFLRSKKMSWIGIWTAIILSLMGISSSFYLAYVSSKDSNRILQEISGHLDQIGNNASDIVTKNERIIKLLNNQAKEQKTLNNTFQDSLISSLNHHLDAIKDTISNEARMTRRELDRIRIETSKILSKSNSTDAKSRAH